MILTRLPRSCGNSRVLASGLLTLISASCPNLTVLHLGGLRLPLGAVRARPSHHGELMGRVTAGSDTLIFLRRRSMASAANLSNAREASIFCCFCFGSFVSPASHLNSRARFLK
jgi:hypothetical protein